MTSTGQNLTMYAGDDKILIVTTTDPNDVPIDVSGCTIRWIVYKRSPQNIVIDKTTPSTGIALTDPTNGIFEITLVPGDTENLLGEYNHECELTDMDSKISTIFVGYIKILASKA